MFTFFLTVGATFAQTDTNPAASPEAVVSAGKARFTILVIDVCVISSIISCSFSICVDLFCIEVFVTITCSH